MILDGDLGSLFDLNQPVEVSDLTFYSSEYLLYCASRNSSYFGESEAEFKLTFGDFSMGFSGIISLQQDISDHWQDVEAILGLIKNDPLTMRFADENEYAAHFDNVLSITVTTSCDELAKELQPHCYDSFLDNNIHTSTMAFESYNAITESLAWRFNQRHILVMTNQMLAALNLIADSYKEHLTGCISKLRDCA